MLVNERGQARVMALARRAPTSAADAAPAATTAGASRSTPAQLRAQRAAAERDVLACGVVLHRLLAGVPALGEHRHGQP